jgi:hypothetical protein
MLLVVTFDGNPVLDSSHEVSLLQPVAPVGVAGTW